MNPLSQPAPTDSPGAYYPQDFSLKTLNLLTGNGKKIELKKLMVDMSYYEDIYTFCSSGYISLIDAQGFVELLRITGNEYLEVNFGKVKNGKNSTDQLFRVYKIDNKIPSGNNNSEGFTLYFCSEELLLSEQTKISKAYIGQKISDIVEDILTEKLKVKTDKINRIEPTTGMYDFTIPKMKAFEAISWISTYARPQKYNFGADMLFFETKDGYNFRSLQSMFKDEIYATYKYEPKNLSDDEQSFQDKTLNVLQYEIGKAYDALSDIASGIFANRLVSIDPLTRSFNVTDFNLKSFEKVAEKLNNSSILKQLQNRLGKVQNESPESVLKVMTGNSNQSLVPYIKEKEGGIAKDIFAEVYVPLRTAQISLANFTNMKIVVPGDPGITAGRTIQFNLPTLKPSTNKKELDKFLSGKYLVVAVRHTIQARGVYQTVMEIAKDSSPTEFDQINNGDPNIKGAVTA